MPEAPVELNVDGRSVRISSPSKPYFAGLGLNKLQVAEYFLGVGPGILAALNVSAAIALLEKVIGHKFLNADVYFIDYLPSQVQTQDVLMVGGAALVLSFLATLYPAWRAARTQPAQALRYE